MPADIRSRKKNVLWQLYTSISRYRSEIDKYAQAPLKVTKVSDQSRLLIGIMIIDMQAKAKIAIHCDSINNLVLWLLNFARIFPHCNPMRVSSIDVV